jgi:hypothetical protein
MIAAHTASCGDRIRRERKTAKNRRLSSSEIIRSLDFVFGEIDR